MAENIFGEDNEFSGTTLLESGVFKEATLPGDADDLTPLNDKKKKEEPAAPKKAPVAIIKKKKEEDDEEEETEEKPDPLKAVNKFFEEETEEEDEDDKPEKEDGDEEEETTKELNQWEAFAKELYRVNIFSPETDDEGNDISVQPKTPEELKQLFENQSIGKARNWLTNQLSKFGDDRRELFDAVFVNGVEPGEYLPVYNRVEEMRNLVLDDEASQEKVVREFYKRAGVADDKITKIVNRLKESAELQNDAEEFHPQLIAQDEQRKAQMEQEAEEENQRKLASDIQYKNSLIKTINEGLKAKDLGGIPMTEKTANQAFDFLYTKKWKGQGGKELTDFDVWIANLNRPENHAEKVKLALLRNSGWDFSKIKQKALSNSSNELFRELADKSVKKKSKKAQTEDSWGDIL